MAEEKQTLLNVKINLTDTIKEMADYQQKIDDISIAMMQLTQSFKNGEKTREQYNQEMMRLKETQKAYKKEIGELSRKTQNEIISQQKYEGTLKGVCAELSLAKDKLRAMKMTDPGWEQQRDYVDKLNAKIKELEQSYGVYQRDVGHYRTNMEKTREEIQNTISTMQQLIAENKQLSPEMEEAANKLQELNDKQVHNFGEGINGVTLGIGALVGSMALLSGAFGEGTDEQKAFNENSAKLAALLPILAVSTKTYQAVEKKGIIQKAAMQLQTRAAAKALTQEAAAEAGSTTATVAHTVAQWNLNAAMEANPIGFIVAAVAALVAGITALVLWLTRSTDAQKAANAAQREYEELLRKSENAAAALEANSAARSINMTKRYQDELANMMKNGATKEQLDKKRQEMETALLDLEIAANKERRKSENALSKSALANYKAQRALLEELIRKKGKDASKTKEQMKVVDEAYKTYVGHIKAIGEAVGAINDAEFKKVESIYNKQQAAADKAYNRAQQRLANTDKRYQEAYKRRYLFEYDYTKSAEENEADKYRKSVQLETALFKLQDKNAKDKLALDLKYGKITKEQYNEQLKVLASEWNTFALTQAEEIAEHTRGLLENAIKLAGGEMLEKQLADSASKYNDARKRISDSDKLSEEEKKFYTEQLNQEEAAARVQINQAAQKKIEDQIKKSVDMLYQYDIRQFSAEETDVLEMEIERLRKQIAERKKAGQNTLADEAALAQKEAQMRNAQLNKELQQKWQNADAQYKLTKDFLEKEIQLYQEGTTARAQLEQELADLTSAHYQKKIDESMEYVNAAMSGLSAMNDLFNNLADRELAKEQKKNDQLKKSLDKRLKAGLISQKEYDKQVAAADEELAKKELDLQIKAAKRQKAIGIMEAAINTAAAIMKIWAEVPKVDFGASTAVLTALAAATGAMQIAAIAAQPLPQARVGGFVQGASHEQGGVLINTEGGERIISKNPSAVFPELLNLISYIGKHSGIPDTGYANAMLGSMSTEKNVDGTPIDYDILADKIGERVAAALAANPPRLAVDEYRAADANYTKIEQSAKM